MIESKITMFNTIRVQHRYDLKDKKLSEDHAGFSITRQEFN